MSAFETHEWESYESLESPGEWESQEWESQEMGGSGEWEFGNSEMTSQEAELAAELLEITSEEELEQFLGKLIKGAAKAVGGVVKGPIGKALGGALKSVAKTELPMAAGALGNLVLPGVGGAIGSKLGSMATKLFEVELEGLGEQEAEFEVARRYVRFASAAARNAARAPSGAPPQAVARAAVTAAARRHAPGLLRGRPERRSRSRFRPRRGGYGFPPDGGRGDAGNGTGGYDGADAQDGYDEDGGQRDSGRWVRQGSKIVIYGA
ncbi:hypothetical protein [Actinomycetospora cinnamomea]|uniref:Uncharacterized protein n=1 Tax=Actinomycetospora cinnamomea TaxID=663609 RepID=A0A2U1E8V7_9PSEU|nr:hypothetical protein [Actinomycetospora cinnamomea]PVY96377.1 hypothetical protein C8D89_13027 [Actinomycetospora cinnamomea]